MCLRVTKGALILKYSIIEDSLSDQNGEMRKMYGIIYDDGSIVRRFEALVTDLSRLEELVRDLNRNVSTLEKAQKSVEDLLFEVYCKYL